VLILGRAIANTGAVELLTERLVRAAKNTSLHVAALAGVGSVLSTLMNNVAALALLMPSALSSAAKTGRSPAALLMPLSFASILGGLVTLIGTPPNIIVSAYRSEATGAPFSMFDFSPVGAAVALVGVAFVALLGWRLIPAARRAHVAAEELARIDDYIAEVRVPDGSALEDVSFAELDADADRFDASLIGLVRGRQRWLASARGERLRRGDVLVVEAAPDDLDRFVEAKKLELVGTDKPKLSLLRSEHTTTAEAVVRADSRLIGRTARTMRLRRRYGVGLLAVSRSGRPVRTRLRDFELRAGDIVLLQGISESMPETLRRLGCLPLEGGSLRVGARRRSWAALGIFAAAIAAATAGLLPLVMALLLAAMGMVLVGAVTSREVYECVDWPVIVLLGAMIPVGGALRSTGATAHVADAVLAVADSPALLVGALLVIAMTLSDVMNNAATAVVMAPIAVSVARTLEASADPFLMAVAVGSSCAFLTPIGHQNNTLILGPGGYRFGDYWRVGLPLEILIVVTAVPLILLVWPL